MKIKSITRFRVAWVAVFVLAILSVNFSLIHNSLASGGAGSGATSGPYPPQVTATYNAAGHSIKVSGSHNDPGYVGVSYLIRVNGTNDWKAAGFGTPVQSVTGIMDIPADITGINCATTGNAQDCQALSLNTRYDVYILQHSSASQQSVTEIYSILFGESQSNSGNTGSSNTSSGPFTPVQNNNSGSGGGNSGSNTPPVQNAPSNVTPYIYEPSAPTTAQLIALVEDRTTYNIPIAEGVFDVSGSTVDASSFTLQTDRTTYKAFAHNVAQATKNKSFTLYIPYKDGDTAVGICPGAATLDAVSNTCPNLYYLANGESKNGATATIVTDTVNSQNRYWKVSGLTGTGGFSTTLAAAQAAAVGAPNTGFALVLANPLAVVAVGAIAALAVALVGKRFVRR